MTEFDGMNALHLAALGESPKTMNLLLKHTDEFHINQIDKSNKENPLHKAAICGAENSLRYILAYPDI